MVSGLHIPAKENGKKSETKNEGATSRHYMALLCRQQPDDLTGALGVAAGNRSIKNGSPSAESVPYPSWMPMPNGTDADERQQST